MRKRVLSPLIGCGIRSGVYGFGRVLRRHLAACFEEWETFTRLGGGQPVSYIHYVCVQYGQVYHICVVVQVYRFVMVTTVFSFRYVSCLLSSN